MAAAVLILLVRHLQPARLFSALARMDWRFLLPAAVLIVPNIGIQVLKWWFLLRQANPRLSLGCAYDSLIVGYPLGFVTPGRLGEIGRAFYVRELNQFRTFKLVVIDKVTNLHITLLFGLVGLYTFTAAALDGVLRLLLLAALLFLTAGAIFAVATDRGIARLMRKWVGLERFGGLAFLKLYVFSGLFFLVYLSQLVCLVFGFHQTGILPASQAAASTFLVKTVLPISFSDLGIREGAAVFFFHRAGVPQAAAFTAAFLLFVINVLVPTLVGLPVLFKGIREVRP